MISEMTALGPEYNGGSRQVSCITLALVFLPSQILVLVNGSSEDQSVAGSIPARPCASA